MTQFLRYINNLVVCKIGSEKIFRYLIYWWFIFFVSWGLSYGSGFYKYHADSSDLFDNFFELKDIVTLSQEDSLIGNIRELQIDSEKNIWILDSKNYCVKKFNRNGKFCFEFGQKGQGPGEFVKPFGFFVDKEVIYISDPMARKLNYFDKKGKFKYFVKIRDGRSIRSRKKGDLIVAASWQEESGGGYCLHIHNKNGDIEKSFLPISEIAKKNKLVCDGVFFDLDSVGNIYGIQEMDYKIFKYSTKGKLITSFSKLNPYYIPPPKAPFKHFYLRSKMTEWVKSWTHIEGIRVLDNLLFVTLRNYDAEDFEYILDIYNTDGIFVNGGLKTNYRLMYIENNEILYFLKERIDSDIDFSILKFSVKDHKKDK